MAGLGLLMVLVGSAGGGQDPESGLAGFFEDSTGTIDARVFRLAALRVEPAESATPFLSPGSFQLRLKGALQLKLRSRLKFRAYGVGALTLSIGGEKVLETQGDDLGTIEAEIARYSKGANAVELTYQSPPSGVAWFRLEWAGRNFEWEPVPPSVWNHRPDDRLGEGRLIRDGRNLVAQSRCARCHAPASLLDEIAVDGMPEMGADAPDLAKVGTRLRPEWLASWIADPQSLRPQATMPKVLTHATLESEAGQSQIADLVVYLQSLGEEPASTDELPGDPVEGGAIFADLGCIGCHLLPGAGSQDPSGHDRIPLSVVAAKWRPGALVEFLQEPHRNYAWTRMPDFNLTEEEASALAGFLISETASSRARFTQIEGGDVSRGEAAFGALGCAQCHESGVKYEPYSAPELVEIEDWSAGCTGEAGTGPKYTFSEGQVEALEAFASRGLASLERRSSSEFATRQLGLLQCAACHTIDDEHDRWAGLAVEAKHLERSREVVMDQSRPPLTWVGEKLHSTWIQGLLDGSLALDARPWLHARMPSFPSRAEALTKGLASRHGHDLSAPQPITLDEDSRTNGPLLLGEQGFACDACHPIGDEPARLLLEFETPNLDLQHLRIRVPYYARWMYSPTRVEPSSKMPRFADSNGLSPFHEYYDGDIRAQYEAIRLYLASLTANLKDDG